MMSPESFCFWLQGFFEMTDAKTLTEKQIELVKKHLQLVFIHATEPDYEKVAEGLKVPLTDVDSVTKPAKSRPPFTLPPTGGVRIC